MVASWAWVKMVPSSNMMRSGVDSPVMRVSQTSKNPSCGRKDTLTGTRLHSGCTALMVVNDDRRKARIRKVM